MKKEFFIWCPIMDSWRHIVVILPISVILQLNPYFRHFKFVCFTWKKFFNLTRKIFLRKLLFSIMPCFWRIASSVAVILQFLSNFFVNPLYSRFGCKITEKRQNDGYMTSYVKTELDTKKIIFSKTVLTKLNIP